MLFSEGWQWHEQSVDLSYAQRIEATGRTGNTHDLVRTERRIPEGLDIAAVDTVGQPDTDNMVLMDTILYRTVPDRHAPDFSWAPIAFYNQQVIRFQPKFLKLVPKEFDLVNFGEVQARLSPPY